MKAKKSSLRKAAGFGMNGCSAHSCRYDDAGFLAGDERRISKAVVDQKEGGGNAKDEWSVQLNSVCFFSGSFFSSQLFFIAPVRDVVCV